jgi:hypothetical protein
MATTDDDVRTWAREHEAAWELVPLQEIVKGEGRRQTGFEIRIYAQTEHVNASEVGAVYARAREIAETVVPRQETGLEFDVSDYDAGRYERRETGYASEIVVPIQATFEDPEKPPDAAATRRILSGIEARLRDLGLRPKAWDARR